MRGKWLWWAAGILLVLGLPVAWYLGSPLFISRTVQEEPAGASAVTLARGTFSDADSFHKGSGTALVLQVGRDRVLRLQDFRVTNGPDLYVYLAVHPQPRSRQDVDQGFVSLGRLKGNVGAQNYAIPAGTEVAGYNSVVIYCRAFHVVFSTAGFKVGQQ